MVRHLRRRRRDRGAAAVEFALVAPLLVVLLFGILEFGYLFFIQSSVAGAARVGVRNYVINYSQANSQANAISVATSAVPDPANVTAASFTTTCTTAGTQTTLVLTYKYASLTGMFNSLLGSTVTVTGKGSMACGG